MGAARTFLWVVTRFSFVCNEGGNLFLPRARRSGRGSHAGALGGLPFDPTERYVTGGGWGKVVVKTEAEHLASTSRGAAAARRGRHRQSR